MTNPLLQLKAQGQSVWLDDIDRGQLRSGLFGRLIDEAALAQALAQRRIAGAALDVFSAEPLAEESPFWKLENCLITPHSAALTQNLWQRHYVLLADNLRRYLDGQPLLGVVDKARGY